MGAVEDGWERLHSWAELSQTASHSREQHPWGHCGGSACLALKCLLVRWALGRYLEHLPQGRFWWLRAGYPWDICPLLAGQPQQWSELLLLWTPLLRTVLYRWPLPLSLWFLPTLQTSAWLRADFLNMSSGQKKAVTRVPAGNRCKFNISHAASRQSLGPAPNLN